MSKKQIDETLKVFEIEPSLSMKGCPYGNAIAKATYKIMKTEFINQRIFSSLGTTTNGIIRLYKLI